MVSEESLAFVDLMRKDDLDRRAGNVAQATRPDERGELAHEDIVDKDIQISTSEDGEVAEALNLFQETTEDSLPATPVSEVALSPESLQAASELFDQASAESPTQDQGEDSQPSPAVQEQNSDAAIDALFSQPEQLRLSPELSQLYSEEGQQTATNEALAQEGVRVIDIPNASGETTILQPESLPDFEAMLRSFDRDYRPPEPPSGDSIEIPPPPDMSDSDPIQNSTEFAEQMIAGMSSEYLSMSRRKP